jgi:hypothetical protein
MLKGYASGYNDTESQYILHESGRSFVLAMVGRLIISGFVCGVIPKRGSLNQRQYYRT